MKNFNIFGSLILSLIIVSVTVNLAKSEFDNIRATKLKKTHVANINSLNCGGKRKFINFNIDGKEYIQRIYIDKNECQILRNKKSIEVKILNRDTIVFEKKDYNDWFEAEIISIITLGIFSLFCIYLFILKKNNGIEQSAKRQ